MQAHSALGATQCRYLNLQEFQSKRLMQDNGITVQQFHIAESLEQADKIAKELS